MQRLEKRKPPAATEGSLVVITRLGGECGHLSSSPPAKQRAQTDPWIMLRALGRVVAENRERAELKSTALLASPSEADR